MVDDLLVPLNTGRGVRVVAMGVTGSGKSYALRHLVAQARDRIDVVYAIDDTDDTDKWGGQRRIDLADCAARPLVARGEGGANVVVLTGDVFARRAVDCEAVGRDAWALAAQGYTAAVAIDELRRAADGQHWLVPDGDLPRIFVEGRKAGLSVFAATNFPQEIPRQGLGQSDLLLFRLGGKEIAYLESRRIISPEVAEVVGRLAMRDFLVQRLGGLPDATVHRL